MTILQANTPCGTPTNVDHVSRISETNKEPCEQLRNEENNEIQAVVPVSIEVQETFLQNLFATLSGHFLELTFSMACSSAGECRPYLFITQKTLQFHPPYGMISRVQVSVQYKTYTVHVMMRMWRKDIFESVEELAEICKMIQSTSSVQVSK